MDKVLAFWRDEEGATAIEYGLIAGLIAVGLLVALTDIGTKLGVVFTKSALHLPLLVPPDHSLLFAALFQLLLLWLLCVAACDIRHRRVPNLLILVGAALALFAVALGGQSFGVSWRAALAAALAGFAGLLVFYALGLMGAADVKFAATLGLWIGPWPLLWVWVGASLLAGAHAVALLAWRRHTGLPRARKREIPYAAHMAVVTMGWLIWQHQMS